ncbi:hypothetical protein D3C87_1638000 [compost metagenome]
MQERIRLQREHEERTPLLDIQAVHMAHRVLGLALRRTEAGEVMLADQGLRRGAHGIHIQRLEAPAGPTCPQRRTNPAAPEQIYIGTRAGGKTRVEFVGHMLRPLH